MLETLRRGVSQLTRLRHPQILIVQHPLEESRESLAFATEPVFASLANILGSTENMPSPPPSQLKNYKLYEVEIKYGLLQVGEGLAFLHSDVKLLHHNICPEVIIVNQQGAWKIFGFDFCIHNHNTQDSQRGPGCKGYHAGADRKLMGQRKLEEKRQMRQQCGASISTFSTASPFSSSEDSDKRFLSLDEINVGQFLGDTSESTSMQNATRRGTKNFITTKLVAALDRYQLSALSPADYPARVRFCQWFLQQCGVNPNFPALVLFTDEAQFTRDGKTNFHNQHVWAYENPRATVPSHHQVWFSLNMWASIIGDRLVGPHVLVNRLTGQAYTNFLEKPYLMF
ncbi:hypothetical protein ANN_17663 [Periplaneta americana]|uniref:Protein kinase domain-containing protein n=1 Tax=Periplaneta americana TaxID=6978 RepID=A0ABQ8STJ2_PERAM|nr:hypothetical protein ANN_17663 [Periplaneta americana]